MSSQEQRTCRELDEVGSEPVPLVRTGLEDLHELRDVFVRFANVSLNDANRIVENVTRQPLDALAEGGTEQQRYKKSTKNQ